MASSQLTRRDLVKLGAGGGLALPALARTGPTTRARRPRAQEPVEISFAGIRTFGDDPMPGLLATFEEQNPSIKVKYIELPTPNNSTEIHQYLVTALSAKNGEPDVFTQDCIWIPELGAAGLAAPVDQYVTDADKEAYFPGLIANCTWDGKTVAWPWFVDGGFLYYRQDLLDKHGFTAPANMDEVASIAAEIMAKEGNPDLHGFLWQGKQAEVLVCDWVEFLGAAGGATLTDNEVTVNNAAGVKALQFMQDTIYKLQITPEAVLTYDEEPSRTPFTNGNGLFLRNWSYVWNIAQDEAESKVKGLVGTQPLPAWPEGKSTATLGGYQFGLNASSKHPDEAWQLLNYLSGPEVQKSFALLGFAPTRPAIYEDAELAAENPFMISLKDVFTGSTARPIHPAYPQMSLAIQSAISGALTNQTPAQEVLDALAEELAAAM